MHSYPHICTPHTHAETWLCICVYMSACTHTHKLGGGKIPRIFDMINLFEGKSHCCHKAMFILLVVMEKNKYLIAQETEDQISLQ